MKDERRNQKRIDARIFALFLTITLCAGKKNLTSALPDLKREVWRWLMRVGGMTGEW